MSALYSSSNGIEKEIWQAPNKRPQPGANVKKAAAAAKKKRTIAHLPKATRTALGKQAAKVARQKRAA